MVNKMDVQGHPNKMNAVAIKNGRDGCATSQLQVPRGCGGEMVLVVKGQV